MPMSTQIANSRKQFVVFVAPGLGGNPIILPKSHIRAFSNVPVGKTLTRMEIHRTKRHVIRRCLAPSFDNDSDVFDSTANSAEVIMIGAAGH